MALLLLSRVFNSVIQEIFVCETELHQESLHQVLTQVVCDENTFKLNLLYSNMTNSICFFVFHETLVLK